MSRQQPLRRLFAERLQRAVVALEVLAAGLGELGDRRRLIRARGAVVGVDGAAREEGVVADGSGEAARGRLDLSREVRREIERSVEAASG